ncbi:MAG: hypothetical protein KF901_04890 [Myxococcales bacterium]|nr:hypothetical protein [Myxococcales bacterium]
MFHGLPWYVWILLAPLLAVVGLGAVAACFVVLLAVLGVGGDLVLGPLERSERWRAWGRRRAMRADREALRRGAWPFARLAHEDSPSIASVLSPVVSLRRPEAVAVEREHFGIADTADGEIVWLVYEADERTVVVGEQRWASLGAWVAEVHAQATDHWLGTTKERGYRERATVEGATLAELLGITLPDARTDIDAFLAVFDQRAPLPYRVLDADELGRTYGEVFADWVEALAHDPPLGEDELCASFPEHALARSWRVIAEPFERDHDEGDPSEDLWLLLDEEAFRLVELRFAEDGPSCLARFSDLDAFAYARLVRPIGEALFGRLELRWRTALQPLEP